MNKKMDSFFLSSNKGKVRDDGTKKQNFQKQKRQESYDKIRNGIQKEDTVKDKKLFDKKAYRLKKYSKKYKLEQWEEQRKKKMLHQYQKTMKNEQMSGKYVPKPFDDDVADSAEVGRFVKHPDRIENEEKSLSVSKEKTKNTFIIAKEKKDKIQQEKLEKRQEIARIKEERMQKLQEYKKKKHERFKKLSKKTKKGQPVMTGRLEMLLERIQKG